MVTESTWIDAPFGLLKTRSTRCALPGKNCSLVEPVTWNAFLSSLIVQQNFDAPLVLAAASTAFASKQWLPSARLLYLGFLSQPLNPAPSSAHRKSTFDSVS